MPSWSNKLVCPVCGSTDTVDTVRLEACNTCGWYQGYPDAHGRPPAGHGTDRTDDDDR